MNGTCTDCLIIRNEFRSFRKRARTAVVDDTESEDEDANPSYIEINGENNDGKSKSKFEQEVGNIKQTLEKAKAHACAYRT